MENIKSRSDAQRASKQKEMKEKELELCAFNAEHIEDSGHTHSLVRYFVCFVFCMLSFNKHNWEFSSFLLSPSGDLGIGLV